MNIGFDLDKVLIDYPPFVPPKLIDKLYKKKDNGVLIYRIPSLPEQLLRRASHSPILRHAIKENLQFLKNIPKDNNKLYLVSSRFKFLEKRTEKLIKKLGLDKIFDGLFFNYENKQPHIFKNAVIKTLNLDIYIDDDLSLIKHVANENPKTIFYWLNQQGKNDQIFNNIFSISKLDDIFKGKGLSVKGKEKYQQ
ncbi:MAG TPA: hypothetical protein VLG67_03350 [Candidatus Saccharimonadales bacterium]|nr:hypothetical protein [Candidatus Saccharimonadales bacterium]